MFTKTLLRACAALLIDCYGKSKTFLSVFLIAIMLSWALVGSMHFGEAQGGTTGDWPMFNHDLAHTGYSTSTVPMTNQTLWTFTTGGAVESSPAVVNGIVYVGSDDGCVYALNAANGALIWNSFYGWTCAVFASCS